MLRSLILDYMKDKKLKYSIYIEDLQSEETFCINEKEVVPSASIIKLFILGKAFEAVNAGDLNLQDRFCIDSKERVPYSIIYSLNKDNSYTFKDIITLMIIQSDNTAANKLINILGIEDINKFIAGLGFKGTVLNRRMMDTESRTRGLDNFTTAEDTAKLLKLIYKGQLINKDFSHEMLEIMKMQLDNSMMRSRLEDDLIAAHKTGNLPGIKHDAGIIYGKLKDYVFTMLTWNAEGDSIGRTVIGEVSKIVYEYLINM